MGLTLVNLTQLALKAAILCEIFVLARLRSLNVTAFGIDRKSVCDFLLVNKSAQSNLGTGRVAAGCPGRGRCSTAP